MKTRRKSKAAVAAEKDQEGASVSNTAEDALTTIISFTVTIPEDIDSEALANLLPDVSFTNPSPDAVVALYRILLAQASEYDNAQRELEDARAEVEKKDIELDQVLQDRESQVKELEGSLENLQNEFSLVKQDRDELASVKTSLEAQMHTLSSSQSMSSTEVDSLKQRVDDVEREKRDLVGVVSRIKEDSAQREEEIQTLRTNLKEARREYQALESELREVKSSETSTKFKVDSLTQQLQLAQSEAERASAELVSKTEEFTKYRRTKHAELSQVQASYDALTQSHAATESALKALQSSHSSQTHQLSQALSRIQELTGRLAEQEATYSSEAEGLRRLVTMMEERENQAKEIVENIEKEWAGIGEKAERREQSLREEAEREKRSREEAERRVEQLETVLERIDHGELPIPARSGTPATPHRTPASSDVLTQGMIGLSPTIAMASKVQRSGKTFTEVYADYVRLQEEYSKKCAECIHMDKTLTAVLAQIEERAPILSQQRAEYERLQSEAAQLTSQLSEALSERDAQTSVARENAEKLAKTGRENDILQRQLEDLGRQVQALLRELARRDDPSLPSQADLDAETQVPAENIDGVITNNLVLFTSLQSLQEQNQKLLRVTREMGEKLEAEEKEYKDDMEREQGEAVREAHAAMQELAAQLERQKKSSETTIQAYMKERDMLKAMLAQRGVNSTSSGSSVVVTNGIHNVVQPIGSTDLAKELSETRDQFEAFKTEMGVDNVRIREESMSAQREARQLHAALAKANATVEYLTERRRMAHEDNVLQAREVDNLTKRNQQLYDQYTRVDIECHRVSEELIVANGRLEQLRNECANLRAEKNIWESIQGRLVEENKTLSLERSHLSDLMANVQKMHSDLERSGENDRRRLESQIQMFESQTEDLRRQLGQEREAVRHLSLQKDIELKELQTRLDKAAQDLSKTRESLVEAEASKKYHEQRVEDLNRQLQGNEEKLAVYERRPSGTSVIVSSGSSDLNREQQVEAEIAELRSSLKIAEVDLATARSHVQQFQEISQASEAALATLNSTHDEFKASTEAQLAKQELECRALGEKLKGAEEEQTTLRQQLRDLQSSSEAERKAWANDKKTLEETIIDMTTSEKHFESDRTLREDEARQREERAKAAEERYDREVLAHAESIKAVEELKHKLLSAETSVRNSAAARETAEVKLSTSEASWKQQREALDKEIADLNTRCSDLAKQNSLLHQHLESVSSQAARIRQAADASGTVVSAEGESTDNADVKLSELRSVVAYLRKEKEIVDLQLELSKQENARLKAQLDHISRTLEETRGTLSQERERAVEAATSETQHAELLQRINQLNILRESNATLRSDCESHAKRARELEAKVEQLSAELDPVKEQARVAQAELESRGLQIQRLEEESRRWQDRNAQLLTKYDRIDPAEMQGLRDQIAQLGTQRAELEKSVSEKEEQLAGQMQRIEALETAVRNHKESFAKNTKGFRERLGQLNTEKSQLNATVTELRNQIKTLTTERDATSISSTDEVTKTLRSELDGLRQEKVALEHSLAEEKAALAQLRASQNTDQAAQLTTLLEERDKLLAEKESWSKTSTVPSVTAGELPDQIRALWEGEKGELIKARDEAIQQAKIASDEAKRATEEIKNVRLANEKFQAKLKDLQKARAADSERAAAQQNAAIAAAVEKVKGEVASASTTPVADASQEATKRLSAELQAQEQRLTAKYKEDLQLAVEAAKAAAQTETPAEGSASDAAQKAAIAAAVADAIAKLQSQHQKDISEAIDRGRLEQNAKGKLKDAQLVRAQNKVKELEAQILEWRQAGIVPDQLPAASGSAPAALNNAASATSAAPATPKTPTSANAPPVPAASNSLPLKPTAAPAAPAPPAGAGRGRGGPVPARGAAKRGLNIRGAAPGRGGHPARGGAPAATSTPPAVASVAPATDAAGGVSIMGAAAKRGREEGEVTSDDSLAKRLKPAPPESGAKTITIRRPPPT